MKVNNFILRPRISILSVGTIFVMMSEIFPERPDVKLPRIKNENRPNHRGTV